MPFFVDVRVSAILLLGLTTFAFSREAYGARAATRRGASSSLRPASARGSRHVGAASRSGHRRAPKKLPAAAAAPARHVPAIRGGLPNVQAMGALVLDENGHELYARNPDTERPIASISKLAATLAVMDRGLDLEGLSTISRSDLEVARGGARSRLLEGMTLSNRDLLHAALMGSDNRAIPALGRAVRLSPTELAAAMTAKAKELGLTKTRFHDPTGLSIENVSTPRETITLLQAVMRHPVLGPITQRVEYDAHPVGRPAITYISTYRPAVRANVQVLGGKTGYNDDARYCLVLAAKIDGHTCFMSFLANEGKLTRFGDVARVADWVVSRKPKGAPPGPSLLAATGPGLGSGSTMTPTAIKGPGSGSSSVVAALSRALGPAGTAPASTSPAAILTRPTNSPPAASLTSPEPLSAPSLAPPPRDSWNMSAISPPPFSSSIAVEPPVQSEPPPPVESTAR